MSLFHGELSGCQSRLTFLGFSSRFWHTSSRRVVRWITRLKRGWMTSLTTFWSCSEYVQVIIGCCFYDWPCSMQEGFSMARSTGSYVLPSGGDLSASFMCAIICVNIHEENPSFFCNASNFIVNGGTFVCHMPDTNHRGMRVCRSLHVLYQPSPSIPCTPGRTFSICTGR